MDFAELNHLSVSELEELCAALAEYEQTPVGIDEFIDSPLYCGNYFQGGLYPYWRKVLREIYPSPLYSPYWLVSFRGAIGQGKTSIACAGMAYDLYRLILVLNPQKSFGLLQSTKILFAIFNRTLTLSTDVVWDKMSQLLVQSPFFNKFVGSLAGRKKKDETLFPKRIDFIMGSRMGHALGQAVHSAIIDEANFEVVEDQTYETFNSILRRMESRFMNPGGGVAGKIWIISSETDKFSAMNHIIDSYKGKKGVYVSQAPLWKVVSHRYKGKFFWVYSGSDVRQPELLSHDSDLLVREPENCIEVPEEHRDAFEADIHAALRDLAGRSTSSSYKLFRLTDRLSKAMCVTPLFVDVVHLDFDDDSDQLANYLDIKNYFQCPLNSAYPRYIHIDIGLSGDRLGLAGSYVSQFKERVSHDSATFEEIREQVPEVITEWCVAVEAKPGKQIPLFKVRVFLQWLAKQGYPISKVTCDGFQSADMLQLLSKMGFSCELLSMDRTSIPYVHFRTLVYEGRCQMPIASLLKRELEGLEVSPDGEKVDHPKKGSKDLADAVGASAYSASTDSHNVRLIHLITQRKELEDHQNNKIKTLFWPGN